MPRGDRTGPQGMGPMTGRAMGQCAGNNASGNVNGPATGGFGRGRGLGRGFGRGFGRGAAYGYPQQSMTAGQELEMLRNQANILQQEMNAVQKNIERLKPEKE